MPNFKIENFLTETYLSYKVLSQDSKNVIYFYLRQLQKPKIAFKKVTSSPLSVFDHCTVKYKDIAFKFGIFFVYNV